tara:strand:+ start:3297 stop:3602 length:306 start_codon:yes stop_codon:yes gene_type:complete
MGTVYTLSTHRVATLPACGGTCSQGRGPCDCGIGALTEADVDRHIAERYGCPTTRRYPRSTSEAFADERAAAVEIYLRPSFLRLAADAVRSAWRDTFRWGW